MACLSCIEQQLSVPQPVRSESGLRRPMAVIGSACKRHTCAHTLHKGRKWAAMCNNMSSPHCITTSLVKDSALSSDTACVLSKAVTHESEPLESFQAPLDPPSQFGILARTVASTPLQSHNTANQQLSQTYITSTWDGPIIN